MAWSIDSVSCASVLPCFLEGFTHAAPTSHQLSCVQLHTLSHSAAHLCISVMKHPHGRTNQACSDSETHLSSMYSEPSITLVCSKCFSEYMNKWIIKWMIQISDLIADTVLFFINNFYFPKNSDSKPYCSLGPLGYPVKFVVSLLTKMHMNTL